MSHVPTTLVVFASSVADPQGSEIEHPYHAYGIYYDSSRWFQLNQGEALNQYNCPSVKHPGGPIIYGLIKALNDAPSHFNLIFETDNKDLVLRLQQDCYRKSVRELMVEGKFQRGDAYQFLLEKIDIRTSGGDCFVKFVYSGEDATAQRGLSMAKELARQALTEWYA